MAGSLSPQPHDHRVRPHPARSSRFIFPLASLWFIALSLTGPITFAAIEPRAQPAPAAATPPTPPPAAPAATDAAPLRYSGEIDVRGSKLGFVVILTPGPIARATIAIPMQGLPQTPLDDVSADGPTWRFTLKPPKAPPEAFAKFEIVIATDQATASGTLKQMEQEFPVTLRRLASGETAEPKRPQNPIAPFPYDAREVKFINPQDNAEFAGTLTLPRATAANPAPFPAAILITGSGTQDRDESLLGHRPFLVLADHLTRAGIAVLRIDDRGYGSLKDPQSGEGDTRTFAGDITSALEFLQTQPEIDRARIGLIGHSEGGLIAPMVASERKDVAFIVLLAGPGVPGDEILRAQQLAIFKAASAPENLLQALIVSQRELMDAAKSDDSARLERAADALIDAQAKLPATPAMTDAERVTARNGVIKTMTSAWMRTFIRLDPRDALSRVSCPVLAINGSLDLQVLPAQNIPEIVSALARGKCTDITALVMPGLNHLFQPATTGGPQEYSTIETTIDPKVLAIVSRWVNERTAKPAKD